jgi:hypothetical protein
VQLVIKFERSDQTNVVVMGVWIGRGGMDSAVCHLATRIVGEEERGMS